jgi:tetratricopeptide (TPR) repeat protein
MFACSRESIALAVLALVAVSAPLRALAQEKGAPGQEGLERLVQEARSHPQDSNAWYNLGVAYCHPRADDKLLATAKHMTEKWPKDPRGWNLLGIAFWTNRSDEAIAAFKKAIELDPSYARPWHNIGNVYTLEGRFESSIEPIKRSLKIKPEYLCWTDLGNSYERVNRVEEALEAYRSATKMNPSNDFAWVCLSGLLLKERRLAEAAAAAQEGIHCNANSTNLDLLKSVQALWTETEAKMKVPSSYLEALCAQQVTQFSNLLTVATPADLAWVSNFLAGAAAGMTPSSRSLLLMASAKLGYADTPAGRADAITAYSEFVHGFGSSDLAALTNRMPDLASITNRISDLAALTNATRRALAALLPAGSASTTETSKITFTNTIVSFTNLQGRTYREVEAVWADREGFVWKEQGDSFGGGRICYTNLPVEFCMSLGIPAEWFAEAGARATGKALHGAERRGLAGAASGGFVYTPSPPPSGGVDSNPVSERESAGRLHRYRAGGVDFRSNPVREYHGTIYNFTGAIKWLADHCPYPSGSALEQDWVANKARDDAQAARWERFLVNGSILEHRPEGIVIEVRSPSVEEGDAVSRGPDGRPVGVHPRYVTVWHTKQILLKNAPQGRVSLPLFAIPVGTAYLAGRVAAEAFDYGRPLGGQ